MPHGPEETAALRGGSGRPATLRKGRPPGRAQSRGGPFPRSRRRSPAGGPGRFPAEAGAGRGGRAACPGRGGVWLSVRPTAVSRENPPARGFPQSRSVGAGGPRGSPLCPGAGGASPGGQRVVEAEVPPLAPPRRPYLEEVEIGESVGKMNFQVLI